MVDADDLVGVGLVAGIAIVAIGLASRLADSGPSGALDTLRQEAPAATGSRNLFQGATKGGEPVTLSREGTTLSGSEPRITDVTETALGNVIETASTEQLYEGGTVIGTTEAVAVNGEVVDIGYSQRVGYGGF